MEEREAGDCWYRAPHPPTESCNKYVFLFLECGKFSSKHKDILIIIEPFLHVRETLFKLSSYNLVKISLLWNKVCDTGPRLMWNNHLQLYFHLSQAGWTHNSIPSLLSHSKTILTIWCWSTLKMVTLMAGIKMVILTRWCWSNIHQLTMHLPHSITLMLPFVRCSTLASSISSSALSSSSCTIRIPHKNIFNDKTLKIEPEHICQ